jgi:hypothetical protein
MRTSNIRVPHLGQDGQAIITGEQTASAAIFCLPQDLLEREPINFLDQSNITSGLVWLLLNDVVRCIQDMASTTLIKKTSAAAQQNFYGLGRFLAF